MNIVTSKVKTIIEYPLLIELNTECVCFYLTGDLPTILVVTTRWAGFCRRADQCEPEVTQRDSTLKLSAAQLIHRTIGGFLISRGPNKEKIN